VAVQTLKENSGGAPSEAVGGFIARQHQWKRLGHLPRFPFDRPHGEVAQRIPRLAPARKLNVDLVRGKAASFEPGPKTAAALQV